jgi:hypothetical protein
MAKVINTQTQVADLSATSPTLKTDIATKCDNMGAAGWILCGTFVVGTTLYLVFEQTS